jgi:hypothetical protein
LLNVSAASDLSNFWLMVAQDSSHTGQQLSLLNYNTRILEALKSPIRSIASDSLSVDSLVTYIRDTCKLIKKEYEGGQEIHKRFILKLRHTIEDEQGNMNNLAFCFNLISCLR